MVTCSGDGCHISFGEVSASAKAAAADLSVCDASEENGRGHFGRECEPIDFHRSAYSLNREAALSSIRRIAPEIRENDENASVAAESRRLLLAAARVPSSHFIWLRLRREAFPRKNQAADDLLDLIGQARIAA
jgi:hypothetical protein